MRFIVSLIIQYFYFTIYAFYHIRPRETAKYEPFYTALYSHFCFRHLRLIPRAPRAIGLGLKNLKPKYQKNDTTME